MEGLRKLELTRQLPPHDKAVSLVLKISGLMKERIPRAVARVSPHQFPRLP